MCARFEQSRTQFTVPQPSELAGQQTRSEERLANSHPVASTDRLATALEHPVVFAAQRARTASADARSGGPTATAIRTPEVRQPAQAVRHDAASSNPGVMSVKAIWVMVAVMSVLVGAAVPLLLYMIR